MPTIFHEPVSKSATGPATLPVATILCVRTIAFAAGFTALGLISPYDAGVPATLVALTAFIVSLFKRTQLYRVQFYLTAVGSMTLVAATFLGAVIRGEPVALHQGITMVFAVVLMLFALDPILEMVFDRNWAPLRKSASVIAGIYRSPRFVALTVEICTSLGLCAMICGVFGLATRWNSGGAAWYLIPFNTGFIITLVGCVLIPELTRLEFYGPATTEPWDDLDEDD